MKWTLRHASHLGYMAPLEPLFRHSVGSDDPVANIDHAAELGLAGVQDVWIAGRPIDEQRRIAAALSRHGLEGGSVAYTARERVREPLWTTPGADARALLLGEIGRACEAAKRINAKVLVVISGARPGVEQGFQRATMAEHLKWAGEVAAREGMVLAVETINAHYVPNMLLNHIADAYAVVKAVSSEAVKLIFDTGHIQAMDGNLLDNLDAVWDEVALVQFADNPRRVEPGAGEINFAPLLKAVAAKGYRGLIEWEHGWSMPDRDCEQRGIAHLHALDAAV